MTDDRQPSCPTCHRWTCVVTKATGVMYCTKCKEEFADPRPCNWPSYRRN